MERSDAINELATALSKAQGEIENAAKNSSNPHFKSKYADLAEVLNTIRPVLSKHGLSIVQMPSMMDGLFTLSTMLLHSSGQYIVSTMSCGLSRNDAQGVGSCTTYLRRYSAAAMVGLAQEDDDGNAATQASSKPANNGYTKPIQKQSTPQPQPQAEKVEDQSYEYLIKNASSIEELTSLVKQVRVYCKDDNDMFETFKNMASEVRLNHGW